MTAQKCVVEGCNLEYDVVCSFSFYNVNTSSEGEGPRQEWIEGAMQEESECLWRHVSLQLCGYHFEMDAQGLWIDSPMLPELLTPQEQVAPLVQSASDKKAADIIRMEHNYSVDPPKKEPQESITRLNVRQLVDTLGYLSLKNLQRKQLWVVKVDSDKTEASITQSEQVITKMTDTKQVIEILPNTSTETIENQTEVLHIIDDANISDNFIYEIAEEQEITMEEVKEIPITQNPEWRVNILPEESKPKYAYIKHINNGKKKRHFTADMNEITLQGDFENYYILPDVDPSVGVEITTTYPENFVVEQYKDPERRKRAKEESARRKKKKLQTVRDQVKQIQVKTEMADWSVDSFEDNSDDYDDKKSARVRRKNKKYLGYDFVT
ncbi:PREDICTED: uncharacterized protein LOC106105956 isoform X4 [Papilio polytes]|uniref:uncharacterized protein LOC106105956 isoform X3 n=1 Tax=Papilio polytes TaxID=76194 RepID=UPI0006768BA2|nr:PREDICTED: uncharacterized protein LOC106105956 isoform X3 [Papilio polytes]XP_013141917.1 PREDICTED: uncharacterized protein LOC106105956 isoform X4 [Papilio polytes]